MAWKKTDIIPPIPPPIRQAISGVQTVITGVLPILSTISTALNLVKALLILIADPFAALVNAAITELENTVHDFFGSGFYLLNVTPFNIVVAPVDNTAALNKYVADLASARVALNKLEDLAKTVSNIEERNLALSSARGAYNVLLGAAYITKSANRRVDAVTGFPLLSPAEAIRHASNSFDDLGDSARPIFSNNATVVGFGLMITAPTLQQFIDVLSLFIDVFAIPEWSLVLREAKKKLAVADPPTSPDWNTLRLASFGVFADLQNDILEMLETLRGYLVVPSNNIIDLIDIIQSKITKLQDAINRLNALLNALTKCPGVYVVNIPLGKGGINRVKQEIQDSKFSDPCFQSDFTMMALFIGGKSNIPNAPDTTPVVDSLRKLFAK